MIHHSSLVRVVVGVWAVHRSFSSLYNLLRITQLLASPWFSCREEVGETPVFKKKKKKKLLKPTLK